MAKSPTLADAYAIACEHWSEDRPGSAVMRTMAGRCVTLLGAQTESVSVDAPCAVRLLAALRAAKLSASYVGKCYGAFKRMLTLAGHPPPATWPKPPKPPRRTRDRLSWDDLDRLLAWLRAKGWSDTADLGVLLKATGLRVRVEALSEANLVLRKGDDFDTLHVTGKGGHEREIPVVATDARALLRSPERLAAMRARAYAAHLDRWNLGVSSLGITSRLATPHAVRHGYASEVLSNTGGNLILVQDLLGHSDPATTARYLHVDMSAKAKGVLGG